MTTYYISSTGNDTTGNGTSGNPWKTMAKAISSSVAGDTINCLAGTFPWAAANFSTGGRTIVGASPPGSTIFDGSIALAATSGNMWTFASATYTISNIQFQNIPAGGFVSPFSVNNSTVLSFTNCILSNIIMDDARYVIGTTGVVWGTLTMTGCLFNNVLSSENAGSQHPSLIAGGTGTFTMLNCTFYQNPDLIATYGLKIVDYATGATFTMKNNIFYTSESRAFTGGGGTPTFAGQNNLFYGWTSPPSLSNQLTSDPLFVDAASANFNLRPTSPAIGAGVVI